MSQKEQIITLHVIPKASRNEIVGWVNRADGGKALKVKVTAPPEDGKANEAVIALLAKFWDCPRRDISLESGATSRHKTIKINNIDLHTHIMASLS